MPNDSLKVPSQIFRWFEKMKTNYEHNIQSVLSRFEANNDKLQKRVDETHEKQIEELKHSQQTLVTDKDKQIQKLENEILYFKQQLAEQIEINSQLNTRYDAVIGCLLNEKRNNETIKDIFADEEVTTISEDSMIANGHSDKLSGAEEVYAKAVTMRENSDFDAAFELFQQAAKQLHVKAMGALGRAYFLSEGTEENQCLGLAWLINAANLGHPQALQRVDHFKESDPFLFKQAELLAADL